MPDSRVSATVNRGLSRLTRVMSGIELDEEGDKAVRQGLESQMRNSSWGEADPVLGHEYKSLLPLAEHQRLVVLPKARHFHVLDFTREVGDAIVDWYSAVD